MASFPTPKYSHLKSADVDKLYEPAEDSFLMMDAMERDWQLLQDKKPLFCLEIGPGSGVIITFLATIIGPKAFYMASDINHHASLSTMNCGVENQVDINTTTDDLVNGLKCRMKNKVDVLIFNPPYVVTSSEEVGGSCLSASWAGGSNGRQVIDKFLPVAVHILSDQGIFYLLLIEQNNPEEIINIMRGYGFISDVVLRRRTGPEHLSVLRFSRM